MIEFKVFRNRQIQHINSMLNNSRVFLTDIEKEKLWNVYLDSFPPGTNKIYKTKREFECSCCRHFIKSVGNLVALKNNELITIWDFDAGDSDMQQVVDAMSKAVKTSGISSVFLTMEKQFGVATNRQQGKDGKIISWNHFWFQVPKNLQYRGTKTLDTVLGEFRTNRKMLETSLVKIDSVAVETALDLIAQNALHRGNEWKTALEQFLRLKKTYIKLPHSSVNNWLWLQSIEVGPVVSRIKNSSIGTLLIDLSEGLDLEESLRKYDAVVAPANYRRSSAPVTPQMREAAKKKFEELGLMKSIYSRFAELNDITINELLFADRSVKAELNPFDNIVATAPTKVAKFDKVEEISISDFINNILPTAQSIKLFFDNAHTGKLMSLIAPVHQDAPSLLKWNNNFRWAYKGNMADSMRELVKSRGGAVDGVLRFSIRWNDSGKNNNDYDAHCRYRNIPLDEHIYFGSLRSTKTGCELDVDIRIPGAKVAVENITFPSLVKLPNDMISFSVYNFAHRGGTDGFDAEIECGGHIYQYQYHQNLLNGKEVKVADVMYNQATGKFTVKDALPSQNTPKKVWNLNTMEFVPVRAIMYSPNYWDDAGDVGHKHLFFMLQDCVSDETPNGFYPEYLRQDLNEHRKVLEMLGAEMKVEPNENQLSGLGFTFTKREELIVEVTGAVKRVLKIKF